MSGAARGVSARSWAEPWNIWRSSSTSAASTGLSPLEDVERFVLTAERGVPLGLMPPLSSDPFRPALPRGVTLPLLAPGSLDRRVPTSPFLRCRVDSSGTFASGGFAALIDGAGAGIGGGAVGAAAAAGVKAGAAAGV